MSVMRGLILYAAALALTAGTACTPLGRGYSGYETLPDTGWRYGDTLVFMPTVADSVMVCDLTLSLRHAPGYAYSNVWLEVTVGDGQTPVRRDTLDVSLCDRYGRWYGSGIGVSYQIGDTVAAGIRYVAGTPVYVRHVMRTDTLAGIEQLGVALTPVSR